MIVLDDGTIKRIHVNQHVIRRNRKHDESAPPFSVKNRGQSFAAYHVDVLGHSEVVYSPDKPLACGAHVWIETKSTVFVYTDHAEPWAGAK